MRQNTALVAWLILGGMAAITLIALAGLEKTPSMAALIFIGGIPLAIGGMIAMVLFATTLHVSLDRNAGLVTIRRGWAFSKKTTTYPLAAVEGAKTVIVKKRKGGQKPGLRPVLLIRDGNQLMEVSLVTFVTNWESNRDAVFVLKEWLAGEQAPI